MSQTKLFQIFRPGRFTAMDGTTYDFSDNDVNLMAAAYSPETQAAPLVIGHPPDQNAVPQLGKVLSLIYKGGFLYALSSVADVLVEAVRAARYRTVSAAFSRPTSKDNPTPGAYYLRHVGFLGEQPPAVKGLVPPAFSERPGFVSFSAEIPGAFTDAADFAMPSGYTVGDAHRLEIHRAALQMQRDCPAVSYCEAVRLVDGIVTL